MSNGNARAMLATLKQGLRGAVFLRIVPEELRASWGQFIGIALLNIVVQFVTDFVRTGRNGEFWPTGLPGVLFGVPVILFACWAVAARARRVDQVLLFATVLSAVGLVIHAASPVIHWLLHSRLKMGGGMVWYGLSYYAAPAWFALASGVAALRLFGAGFLQKSAAFLLAALLIGAPLSLIYTNKTLWWRAYDEKAAEAESSMRHFLESEDVLFLQASALERELAALRPGGGKGMGVYFVGMAGYSDQDVFMKEVRYVARLFRERYGAEHHTVELINNPQTVADAPIASVTSLRLSLKRVAHVMDRDRDILFLYLTSHGSRDHKFSLDFGSMRFNVLDPFRLREILDESGIRRRVVVISACYSGGFIDALKDDNTLVITSAAADRTSFGCSNDADFTYFGKAYFHDALRSTNSFVEAFDLARPLIAQREGRENYEHSDPQIYVGAAMRDALAAFSRQQSARHVAAARPQLGGAQPAAPSGAMALLQQRALAGQDGAQFELGASYQFGRGVTRDYALAVEWLQKSAAQGNTKAMCNLGWAYEYGRGVPQDYTKARYLYERAAALGDADAQLAIGDMYLHGEGVKQDYAQAYARYRKVAGLGNARGQLMLGQLYQLGQGVKQDDAAALQWYQKAADQGSPDGYNELGYLLLQRRQRMPEAIAYLEKALKLAPNNYAIMDSLGWGYYLTGRKDEGLKWLQRAYAGLKDPEIAAHLGEALWVRGEKAQGAKVWREAAKVHPRDATLNAVMKKFLS